MDVGVHELAAVLRDSSDSDTTREILRKLLCRQLTCHELCATVKEKLGEQALVEVVKTLQAATRKKRAAAQPPPLSRAISLPAPGTSPTPAQHFQRLPAQTVVAPVLAPPPGIAGPWQPHAVKEQEKQDPLVELKVMGFEEDDATEALRGSDGTVQGALSQLLATEDAGTPRPLWQQRAVAVALRGHAEDAPAGARPRSLTEGVEAAAAQLVPAGSMGPPEAGGSGDGHSIQSNRELSIGSRWGGLGDMNSMEISLGELAGSLDFNELGAVAGERGHARDERPALTAGTFWAAAQLDLRDAIARLSNEVMVELDADGRIRVAGKTRAEAELAEGDSE
jgi:hypothetical protein